MKNIQLSLFVCIVLYSLCNAGGNQQQSITPENFQAMAIKDKMGQFMAHLITLNRLCKNSPCQKTPCSDNGNGPISPYCFLASKKAKEIIEDTAKFKANYPHHDDKEITNMPRLVSQVWKIVSGEDIRKKHE